MSTWRGFIPESKSFMSYETMTLRECVGFWVQFPSAYIRYKKLEWRDRRFSK